MEKTVSKDRRRGLQQAAVVVVVVETGREGRSF
jgi:hypothetical protein